MNKSFSKNSEHTRVIIIGDIHGCFDEFLLLLKKVNYSSQADRLILVGDVVNKGPDTLKVLDWIAANSAVEVIKGNHELKLLEAAANPLTASKNMQILIGELGSRLEGHMNMIKAWPMYIDSQDFMVVHGGIVPGEHPSETDPHIIANIRYWDGLGTQMNNNKYPAWYELYLAQKLIVYGHWAIQGLNVRENTIGLDSGCVYGNELTALILPERKIEQVKAARVYCF